MKNRLLKYYIVAVYLCSTVVLFAQPGTTDTGGTLEDTSGDTTPAPIDNYVWVLALIGLIFVFMKFRAIQKSRIQG
jgi:hypothetical protein